MEQQELTAGILKDMAIALPDLPDLERLQFALAEKINVLIQTNFDQLVMRLYRIDIAEKKLRGNLGAHSEEDAGHIIAGMVIARELEKMASRKHFNQQPPDEEVAELW